MKMMSVLVKVRSSLLPVALILVGGFLAGCTSFTPTGKPVKITIELQKPVTGKPVTFDTKIGTLTGIRPKVKGAPQNASLYFNATNRATVNEPTFTLEVGAQKKTLFLTVEKGKLLGKTVVLAIYDHATQGEDYFGAHAYSVEGNDCEPHEVRAFLKSGSTIKIK